MLLQKLFNKITHINLCQQIHKSIEALDNFQYGFNWFKLHTNHFSIIFLWFLLQAFYFV